MAPPPASAPADADLPQLVTPDFFLVDGKLHPGMDPNKTSDAEQIHDMTRVHVQELERRVEDLGPAGIPTVHKYIGDLRAAHGWERVSRAFVAQKGASVMFFVKESEAKGRLKGLAAEAAERAVQPEEQTPLAKDMCDNAEARNWNDLLLDIERSSSGDRKAVLEEGATLVYVRERVHIP